MKIRKIADMCKKERQLLLLKLTDEDGNYLEQWGGTPSAVYPLYGLPMMRAQELASIFDLAGDLEGMQVVERSAIKEKVLPDIHPADVLLQENGIRLRAWDKDVMVLHSFGVKDRAVLLDRALLAPIMDELPKLLMHQRGDFVTIHRGMLLIGQVGVLKAGTVDSHRKELERLRSGLDQILADGEGGGV